MRLADTIKAYGTSEGVTKEWDTRGRGKKDPVNSENCVGPNCGKLETKLGDPKNSGTDSPIVVPHLDNLEFMMTSNKEGTNIHFDKEAMKTMLRMALVQLDRENAEIQYQNTNLGGGTDHYATIKFRRSGVTGAGVKNVR